MSRPCFPQGRADAGNVRIIVPIVVAAMIFGFVMMMTSTSDLEDPPIDGKDVESTSAKSDEVKSNDDRVAVEDSDRTDGLVEVENPIVEEIGEARSIAGVVRHALTLEPIEGARIELRVMQGWQNVGEDTLASAETDSEGRYRLRAGRKQSSEQVILLVTREGFVGSSQGYWTGIERDELATIYLNPGVKVTGTVTAASGPVSKGEVWAVANLTVQPGQNWNAARQGAAYMVSAGQGPTMIDSSGRFTLYTNGDLVAVQAKVPGYAPAYSEAFNLKTSGDNQVKIEVSVGKQFQGIVRNGAGDPVAGAKVRVTPVTRDAEPDRNFQRYVTSGAAETGADGRFSIADMPDQVTQLNVSHDDYIAYNEWNFRGSSGGDPVEIELKGGQWVVGVARLEVGTPLPAGRATMQVQTNNYGWQPSQVTISEGGKFKTSVVDETVATFTMKPKQALSKEIKWEPGPGAHDVGEQVFEIGKLLTVTVLNGSGEALENAYVTALPKQYAAQPWMFNQSGGGENTDASGKVVLRGMNTGEYTLSVRREGYSLATSSVHFAKEDDALSHEVTLNSSARLLVTVHDDAGQPLSGISAFLVRAGAQTQRNWWNPTSQLQSGPDGRLAVSDVEVGVSHTLTLSRPGLSEVSEVLDAFEDGEVRDLGVIVMDSGASIRGTVMSTIGGALEGAVVTASKNNAFRGGYRGGQGNKTAASDETGSFVVTGLDDGTWQITCTCQGYITTNQSVTIADGRSDPVVFKLEAGKPFEGIVEYDDGKPASGVYLNIWGGGGGNYNAQTDAEGRFRFESTPTGAVTLNVYIWGQGGTGRNYNESFQGASVADLPTKISIPAGATIAVSVSVNGQRELPTSVNLVLMAAGNSSGRVWINNQGSATKLDKEGNGVREGLQSGSYDVYATAKDFPDTERQRIELVAGETVAVNVVLDGTASAVTIVVKDMEGNPVPRANVAIGGNNSNNMMNGMVVYNGQMGAGLVTDAEGKVTTYDLVEEDQTVSVNANGYAPASIKDAVSQIAASKLVVTLESESAFLVTVFDSDGEPLDGVYVNSTKLDKADWQPASSTGVSSQIRMSGMRGGRSSGAGQTSGGGFVRLGGLTAGNYRLTASYMGETFDNVEAVLGVSQEKAIDITRPEGITVRGRALMNGAPITTGSLQFTTQGTNKAATLDEEGGFELELTNTGKYRVYFGAGNNRLDGGEHEIADSTTLELEFTAVRLTGTVKDPTGKQLGGVRGYLRGRNGTAGWYNFVTDSEGNYTVEAMSPGDYILSASPPDVSFYAPQVEIQCQNDTVANYQFESARTLTIVVIGQDLPAQLWVQAVLDGGKTSWVQVRGTPADGLTVSWPADVSKGYISGQNLARTVFDVAEGQETVEVVVEPGGQLMVTVMENGERISDHPILIESADGGQLDRDLSEPRTANNGVAWTRLVPGSYKISTTLPSGEKFEETTTVSVEGAANITLGTAKVDEEG